MLHHPGLREVRFLYPRVLVEHRPGLLAVRKAGGGVDPLQIRQGEGAAGAVADDNGGASLHEQLRQGRQQHRMGGGRLVGLQKGDEIGFDQDPVAPLHEVQPAQGGQGLPKGRLGQLRFIGVAGDDGHVQGSRVGFHRCFLTGR